MWYNVKSYGGIKLWNLKIRNKLPKFTFTIEPELFNKGLDHAFDKVKGDVEVKGFRKDMYHEKFMKVDLVLNHYMKKH